MYVTHSLPLTTFISIDVVLTNAGQPENGLQQRLKDARTEFGLVHFGFGGFYGAHTLQDYTTKHTDTFESVARTIRTIHTLMDAYLCEWLI